MGISFSVPQKRKKKVSCSVCTLVLVRTRYYETQFLLTVHIQRV